jgi:hypothetical protein
MTWKRWCPKWFNGFEYSIVWGKQEGQGCVLDAYRHIAILELEGGSFLETVDYKDFSKIA